MSIQCCSSLRVFLYNWCQFAGHYLTKQLVVSLYIILMFDVMLVQACYRHHLDETARKEAIHRSTAYKKPS